MPSVVRVEADGTLVAGEGGPRPAVEDPSRIGRDFKRRLGDPTPMVLGGQPHSAVSLLAATLTSVLETVTRLEGGPPTRVVLTYPAVWGPYRREQFDEVPRRAGLDEDIVTVLTEPEAAATHYAGRAHLAEGDVVGVYDLGGGTFDTTVTRLTRTGMEILGIPEGVEWVGGVDFDEAVLAYVDKALGGALSALDPRNPAAATALARVRDECIRAKEALSRESATNIVVLLPHRTTQIRLTRADFENMVATPLESTLAALRRTLDSAGTKPADLAGVLLVGGSSRIPLVARMLSDDLGRPVLVDQAPQHCVALGAATLAGARLETGPAPVPAGPGNWHLRRRVIAVTAAAAVLIGGAALVAYEQPNSNDAAAPATPTPGGRIGAASTTTAPTPSPPKAKPAAAALKYTPIALPVTDQVLGLGARCLDIANAISTNGTGIGLFGCNGSPAQRWTLAADNTFRALGKCMAVLPAGTGTGGSGATGPQIELETCDHSPGQHWLFEQGAIVNQHSKLCLEVLDRDPGDRSPLTTDTCRDGDSQLWSLPPGTGSGPAGASLGTPRLVTTIRGLGSRPQGVAISPDGSRAYVPNVGGHSLSVIDTSTSRVLRTIQMPTAPQYVVAAPDDRRLYVTLNDRSQPINSVQVVDALTGTLLTRIRVGRILSAPALSPDGLRLYVPDASVSQVAVIDTSDYQVTQHIVVAAGLQQVAFAPDGGHAYSADSTTGLVSVLDVGNNTESGDIPVAGRNPATLAVSPDGQQVAVADPGDGMISFIDLTDHDVTSTVTVGSKPHGLAYSPDGNHLYVANDGSGTVTVIDVQTGRVSSTVRVGGKPWAVAVAPNGRHTYVTDSGSDAVSVLATAR